MIIKVKSHHKPTFKKLLNYMLNNKDRLFDNNKESFVLTHNLRGNSINEWVKQYQENETYRQRKRSNSIYLTHEILSWHRDDFKNISLDKMHELARRYVQLRNPNGTYVAVPHFDRNHLHVHICASAIEYRTGKTMRMSKFQFKELKQSIERYQHERFPELIHSVVEHGQDPSKKALALSDEEFQIKKRTGRATNKENMAEIINQCLSQSDSISHFLSLLKENGLTPYERGGKLSGVWFNNKKYRFKRLDVNQERLRELGVEMSRNKELRRKRERNQERRKNLGKWI